MKEAQKMAQAYYEANKVAHPDLAIDVLTVTHFVFMCGAELGQNQPHIN